MCMRPLSLIRFNTDRSGHGYAQTICKDSEGCGADSGSQPTQGLSCVKFVQQSSKS